MELSTMITRAQQQQNVTATQLDSSDFFVRSLEEYKWTLSVLTTRIEESHTKLTFLHQLPSILNKLQCHFEGIAEESMRDMDWFEELATQPIVMITRNGKVGQPQLALALAQLETLHGTVVFQLPRDIIAFFQTMKK